jgi:hypothetical protein
MTGVRDGEYGNTLSFIKTQCCKLFRISARYIPRKQLKGDGRDIRSSVPRTLKRTCAKWKASNISNKQLKGRFPHLLELMHFRDDRQVCWQPRRLTRRTYLSKSCTSINSTGRGDGPMMLGHSSYRNLPGHRLA